MAQHIALAPEPAPVPDPSPGPAAGSNPGDSLAHGFRLGAWLVEPQLFRLTEGDRVEHLEPKVMRVLVRLAAESGEMVPREVLRAVGWGDTYAAEEGLRRAVMLLRRTFRDDARAPRFIETIPRAGYRLLAPVRPLVEVAEASEFAEVLSESDATEADVPVASALEEPAAARRGPWLHRLLGDRKARLALAALVVAALSFAALAMALARTDSRQQSAGVAAASARLSALKPLTTYPGRERDASLSPDGHHVAFVWAEDGGTDAVYVRPLDDEVPRQLTEPTDPAAHPAWSPDGRWVAYARYGAEATQLMIADVADGSERTLAELPAERVYGVAWSPDGRWLAFAQRPKPGEPVALFRLEVATRYRERLTAPPVGVAGDLDPAWSPDGEELVFVRRGILAVSDLYALNPASGSLRRLTELRQAMVRPTWSPDGEAVLFARLKADRYVLSWVPASGGASHDLDLGSDHIVRASAVPAVDHLVVERLRLDTELWRLDLTDAPQPVRWLSSTSTDRLPAFSTDGQRVAFVSERSGSSELWVADAGSRHPRQLTSIGSGLLGRPQWSPDGSRIAFDSSSGGNVDVHLITVDGAHRQRLTEHRADDCLPFWSRDGDSLYFASNRTGRWQVWRRSLASGNANQITRDGGLAAAESFDGRWLYFVKPKGVSGLWRQPLDGGSENQVLANFDPTVDWALTEDGVYFVDREDDDHGTVVYRDLPQGEERTVWELEEPAREYGMAVSGDGRYLALALLHSSESDLLLTKW
ncbi:MAG: winged helix-turn-helix domain-containing protein [Acidobacteriota bacterium]